MVLYTELCNTTSSGNSDESSTTNVNLNYFNCHNNGTSYEVLTIPMESNCFMSCGEDGTVRLYDLRQSTRCHKTCCKDNILVFSHSAITAMALSPISSTYLAAGSSDGLVRIYDRRFLTTTVPTITANGSSFTTPVKAFAIPSDIKRPYRVTSVKYSTEGSEILVSYSSDYLYIFDTTKEGVDENSASFKKLDKNSQLSSSPPVRKLRLRGDWSDTGPNARPEGSISGRVEIGQVRPQLHGTLMHRMTEVLSRMLSDPRTRIGLSGQSNELNPDNPSLFVTAARELENEANRRQNNEINAQPGPSGIRSISTRTSPTIEEKNDVEDSDLPKDSENTSDEELSTKLDEEISKIEMETKAIIHDYVKQKFTGHRNARTMIKETCFWGEHFVMSGSDCGHVFVWNRNTAKLEMLFQADNHVVNCLQPHPNLPYLATSGIDYDVKLWAPILQESTFDEIVAAQLMERNAIMLEETKDTITVPAAFMIRMLACIHSLRNRNRTENTLNMNARSNSDP
ncbi:DCAF6 family protein [Megaselia abdita]